jgi:Flp pilus assembly protein TadG
MSVKPFSSREQSQILPMVALLAVVLIAMVGLAIDVGRIMVAKAQLVRAVDAAALAGALKLPDLPAATTQVNDYMAANEPSATWTVPSSSADRQIEVHAEKHVDLTFLSVLTIIPGIDLEDPVTVSAEAVAGFGVVKPVDVQLVMDDTGTMKSGCNSGQTNSDCPIKQARDGANLFVDTLLSSSGPIVGTQVGMNPFRGCYGAQRYNPVTGELASRGCILFSSIVDLTSDPATLHTAINTLRADGGYPGTNLCLGLYEAKKYLVNGQHIQTGASRYLVILTDGDNTYTDGAQSSERGNIPNSSGSTAPPIYPPPQWPTSGSTQWDSPCRIGGFHQDSTDNGTDYDNRVNALDSATYTFANQLKAAGVEIYVIGYGVVGTSNSNPCNLSQVGTGSTRQGSSDSRDRNLAKCIASSTQNTNDHYFEAPTPQELPAIFKRIAVNVAFRLIK